MANESRRSKLDLTGSVAAFGRIAYSDLLTIAIVSVLTALVSLPLATIGVVLVSFVDRPVVDDTFTGARRRYRPITTPPTRRETTSAAFGTHDSSLVVLGMATDGRSDADQLRRSVRTPGVSRRCAERLSRCTRQGVRPPPPRRASED